MTNGRDCTFVDGDMDWVRPTVGCVVDMVYFIVADLWNIDHNFQMTRLKRIELSFVGEEIEKPTLNQQRIKQRSIKECRVGSFFLGISGTTCGRSTAILERQLKELKESNAHACWVFLDWLVRHTEFFVCPLLKRCWSYPQLGEWHVGSTKRPLTSARHNPLKRALKRLKDYSTAGSQVVSTLSLKDFHIEGFAEQTKRLTSSWQFRLNKIFEN